MERPDAAQRAAAPAVDADRIAREMTERFRQVLSTKRMNELSSRSAQSQSSSPAPRDSSSPHPDPAENAPPSYRSLRNIPLVPQAPQDVRSFRFRNQLISLSQMPVRWENPGLLDDALRVVPLSQIYDEAEEHSQILQAEAESLRPGKKAAWGHRDCLIMALMKWFKRSFFAWVDNPPCSQCGSATFALGRTPPTPDEQGLGTTNVELYKCADLRCAAYERFPRYNDAFVLLQTRKGRGGEWVNCFGMLCRALGARTRWVWNSEDNVWIEVYSEHQKRWVFVDVCEGVWDRPLLYTEGWRRKMAYCIAFSNDGATDVTRRYVRNPSKALERRRCPEAVLLHILDEIRAMRRANMSKQAKFILQGEDMREAKELRDYIIQSIAHNVSKISVEDILSGRSSRPVRADPDAQKASEARANAGPEYLQARGESNAQNPREPQR